MENFKLENEFAYENALHLINIYHKGNNVPITNKNTEAELLEWTLKQYNDVIIHINWQLKENKEVGEFMVVWLLFTEELIRFFVGCYLSFSYQTNLLIEIVNLKSRIYEKHPEFIKDFKLDGYN